jgi:uncharacterized protein YjiS (DUF1127 family)
MATNQQPPGIFQLPERAAFVPQRPSPGAILPRALALALAWHERARQRRRLMQLDNRALNDIGIRRDEAERECRSPFWRPFWPAAMDL